MAFNTGSFLAGVGAVVAVLSTGFAGGYMVANPNHAEPPNRLQRLAADNANAKAVTPAPVAAEDKPRIVADAAQPPQPSPPAARSTTETPAPQPVAAQAGAKPEVMAEAQPPVATPAPAPAPATIERVKPQMAAVQPINSDRTNTDRAQRAPDNNIAENKASERKRSDSRKYAEQQRRQRELEVATIAVRRIIHDRNAQEVVIDDDQPEAPAPQTPHFNLFRSE